VVLVRALVQMLDALAHAEHNPVAYRNDSIRQNPWEDAESHQLLVYHCLAHIRRCAQEWQSPWKPDLGVLANCRCNLLTIPASTYRTR
jgi:hypothetical protein